jgi:hypothetical protein
MVTMFSKLIHSKRLIDLYLSPLFFHIFGYILNLEWLNDNIP